MAMQLLAAACAGTIGFPAASFAADSCPTRGFTLLNGQSLTITGACTVEGDITLQGASLLTIRDARFVLRGNLTAGDSAIVYVQSTEFIVDNSFSTQWSMTTLGTALLWFNKVQFRSSEKTDANYFMAYLARNSSKLWVTDSALPTATSFFLARAINTAQIVVTRSQNFPSEIFVENQASVRVAGGTDTTLWLPFDIGARATLTLPDQSAGPYSWNFGRSTPGVVGIGYDVAIVDSLVRLGVNSRPWSQVTIVGTGKGPPDGSGEISIGYSLNAVFTPQTISGLRPGYQAFTQLTHQGRSLVLQNVELDPVGWSVWVSAGPGLVTIRDSILNEVASWSGNVEVQTSVLQWAVLGSNGPGSSVVVRDSSISSQLIFANAGGHIEVHDSIVTGSPLAANDASTVSVFGGQLETSGSVRPCDWSTGLTSSGVPLCNPFVAPGVLPSVTTVASGQVIIDGVPPPAVTDLQLVGWTAPDPVSAAGSFTYTVQAGNAGPDAATGVSVRFKTPTQAIVESVSPGCTPADRDVICQVGSLSPFQASAWLSVTYRVASTLTPAVGEVTVTGDQFDPDPTNHRLRLTNAIQ
ncbi:MAG: hypothetical protein DMF87_21165 [Acidobacteria bacterium]|nr:MAG: hypothetical protein DMF88_02825 [Acidobacteriota bacterium]PYR75150.1 MAG: hypothetical protein DMF87_21165 [Acidobacteriota bacterium]